MIKKTVWTVVMGSTLLTAGTGEMKLYDVESGKVEYGIKGSGNMMGMTMKTVGKKRLIFAEYGARTLTEENKITKQNMMGQVKVEKNHTMTYMKNGIAYQVDFDRKRIMRMGNMGAMIGMLSGGETNMKKAGEAMMKQMGGKKTGTDKVLGYTCDVWEVMGTKQCLYKGIPLRVETDVMGIKNTEVATKAVFDISISDDDFKLPDFPIYDMQGNKLDKNTLDTADAQDIASGEKAGEAMAEMAKAMAAAAQSVGLEDGKKPTKSQEKAMEDAMMNAMLPQVKQGFLAQEDIMRSAYKCFSHADTKKEAKICSDKISAATGEPEEALGEWTPQTKKETLEELDTYLNKIIPCIKKAQSMKAIDQCMPQE